MKSSVQDKFYAVITNDEQKIYFDWPSCQKAVKGVSNAIYKKFSTKKDAENFITQVSAARHTAPATPVAPVGRTGATGAAVDDGITVYTDGSGSNGGGFGVVIIYPNDSEKDIYKAHGKLPFDGTSQAAELYAIHVALSLLEDVKDKQINIYTDSQYSISSLSGYYDETKKVPNKELLSKITEQMKDKKVKFQHVSAHSGIEYNEECDRLARLGSSNKDHLTLTKNGVTF
jgi:ribonuclease HI